MPENKILILKLDLTKNTSINEFIKDLEAKFEKSFFNLILVDVLINNAGVAVKGDKFDIDVVNYSFETNYFGTVYLCEQIIHSLN